MKNNLSERRKQASIIEDKDVENLTESIFNHHSIGGEKVSLLLLENKKGLIRGTFCQEAKSELTALIRNHLFEKRNQAELEKMQIGETLGVEIPTYFSDKTYHIWSKIILFSVLWNKICNC